MIDLRNLLESGHANLYAAKDQAELANKGSYRVGTSGAVADDGEVYGTCHRKALARALGKESYPGTGTAIMWASGEALEDTLTAVLQASGFTGKILRHADVLVQAEAGGKPLMGHPDIVLADDDGKLLLGIESKGVFGGTTALSAALELKPKNANLIQAAIYSHCLNVPYVLLYTNPSWFKPHFSEQKRFGVKNIKPFYSLFHLEWRDDVLFYRHESETEWTRTKVTWSGVMDYYALVTEMQVRRDLGPRVSANYVNGDESKWGAEGDCTFCAQRAACDQYDIDQDWDTWVASLDKVSSEGEA